MGQHERHRRKATSAVAVPTADASRMLTAPRASARATCYPQSHRYPSDRGQLTRIPVPPLGSRLAGVTATTDSRHKETAVRES